jgi:predicted small secreted protein
MKKILLTFAVAALMLVFTGCDKTNDGNGRLVVNITDAPFPVDMVESAEVTITKLEIRKAGDGISDECPFEVIWEGSETFNLLELRNGVIAELLDLEIPSGEYNLLRLYVDEAALKVKEGESYKVKVPSGSQTGIKIFISPGVVVEGGLTTELILDFDLSNSFVMQGNMNSPAGIKGFIFKPVIRAVNNSKAGRLEGKVTDTDGSKIKEASVTVKQDTIVATAVADTMGYYAILGLPSGSYSVIAAKENFDTLEVENVIITNGNKTVLNLELAVKP